VHLRSGTTHTRTYTHTHTYHAYPHPRKHTKDTRHTHTHIHNSKLQHTHIFMCVLYNCKLQHQQAPAPEASVRLCSSKLHRHGLAAVFPIYARRTLCASQSASHVCSQVYHLTHMASEPLCVICLPCIAISLPPANTCCLSSPPVNTSCLACATLRPPFTRP